MTKEIIKQENPLMEIAKNTGFTPEDIETMKNTVFQELKTPSQFKMALSIAKKYDLDPFAKEIWGWIDKQGRLIIISSASGIAKIIRRQDGFKSLVAQAVYPEDEFEMDPVNNEVKHKIQKRDSKSNPLGAYAILKLGNEVIIQWVDWHEYAPAKAESWSVWSRQKSAMIQKCAITVLGRQSIGLSGIYGEEEMEAQRDFKQETIETNQEEVKTIESQIKECKTIKELQQLASHVKTNKELFNTYAERLKEITTNQKKDEENKDISK